MKKHKLFSIIDNQQGISAVIVAICLFMLVGFVALAIDVGHLYVAKNELQNAADAGALAGAMNLYSNTGDSINQNANQFGFDASVANLSENVPVDVNWTGGNTGDVQRGHWSFGWSTLPRGFYPNNSTALVQLYGVSDEQLDANEDFINAVRVRVRRESTPIASFFARIFGFDSFQAVSEAIAYIGFAGKMDPANLDFPIAICQGALEKEGHPGWTCSEGRFINDATGGADEETGAWTSLNQDLDADGNDICSSGTNANEVKQLVDCVNGIPDDYLEPLIPHKNLNVNNGMLESAFNSFYNCWKNNYKNSGTVDDPTQFMEMLLPVIDCENDPTTCAPLVGAVWVNVIWVTPSTGNMDVPEAVQDNLDDPGNPISAWDNSMATSPPIGGIDCSVHCASSSEYPTVEKCMENCIFDDFADHYGLKDADDENPGLASLQPKTIYFLPSCKDRELEGTTGGKNFGVLAKIPVLVK
ncbi:MAG: hypothetical protein JSV73_04995 [Flavobacteriaceae bacterium]|nr:MAG: hypothetical protein JSV73_04995 [Flavobacteriaceae bacterium]